MQKRFQFKRKFDSLEHQVSDSDDSDGASASPEPKLQRLRASDSDDAAATAVAEAAEAAAEAGAAATSAARDKEAAAAAAAAEAAATAAAMTSGLFLTKVAGIDEPKSFRTMNLKEILSSHSAELLESVQMNYMFDIEWLLRQYPQQSRRAPVTIVHGDQGAAKAELDLAAMRHDHVTLVQARLDIPYGTHHSKMMLLRYTDGLRVVVHTANMIERDWFQKTQAGWISDILPRRPGDSATGFSADLQAYLLQYRHQRLARWAQVVSEHDFSAVSLFLVASCPGRFAADRLSDFGHLKLRKSLRRFSFGGDQLVAQFSSIGSLGPSSDRWLMAEFADSLAAGGCTAPLRLVFPCVDDVRCSLEGYAGGASLPYACGTAARQQWLRAFMHRWQADRSHRTLALPHMKSYLRCRDSGASADWYLITSANLSKAAWGCLEKAGTQLMVRSYEIGVLLVARLAGVESFGLAPSAACRLPLPYDLPLLRYANSDQPWIVDMPHVDKADSHGQMWCPQ